MKKIQQRIKSITEPQRLALAATVFFNAFIILICKDSTEWACICFLLSFYLWITVFFSAVFGKHREPEEKKSKFVTMTEVEWHEIAEMVTRQRDYKFN